jgi:hypothetical protein
MRFVSLFAAVGLLVAGTLSAYAAPAASGLRTAADSSHIVLVKKKKKKKKKDVPGKCGTMKFYSKKAKKCVSAVDGK